MPIGCSTALLNVSTREGDGDRDFVWERPTHHRRSQVADREAPIAAGVLAPADQVSSIGASRAVSHMPRSFRSRV